MYKTEDKREGWTRRHFRLSSIIAPLLPLTSRRKIALNFHETDTNQVTWMESIFWPASGWRVLGLAQPHAASVFVQSAHADVQDMTSSCLLCASLCWTWTVLRVTSRCQLWRASILLVCFGTRFWLEPRWVEVVWRYRSVQRETDISWFETPPQALTVVRL